MFGPDQEQQARMAAQVDQSIDEIERQTSAFMGRLVARWAVRWAVVFAVIFALTQLVDWLDWGWWVAVPIAVLSLAVPLLFRRFLMKRLERMRGQMGGFGGQGETIDGSWRDAPPRHQEPGGVIIDQRDPPHKAGDDDGL